MNEKLLSYLREQQLDAFFISRKENVRFASGYTGDDAYLLITREKGYLITDPRYTEQAAAECPDFEVYIWRVSGSTVADAVACLAQRHGVRRLGFEADVVTFAAGQQMQDAVPAQLVPTTNVVERMRAVKSLREIECLKAACDISCRAFERILKDIRVGRTEKELAARLSLYMVEEGADTQPYGNILISGARTSLLHGIPSDKSIAYGDFVLLDFGCQYKGYLSDMTRTVIVGKPTARQREVYGLAQRMIEDALDTMQPGVAAKTVYEASARAVLGTEYEQYHYQGVGHGIGLFVHELPFFRPNSDEVLVADNVTTIEPGLYIPGWGGVRIEDQVWVREGGNENMISITHELIEL